MLKIDLKSKIVKKLTLVVNITDLKDVCAPEAAYA